MEKTLDVIVPLYNEKDCIEELMGRLFKLREDFKTELVDTRFIFVNDGSTDCSPEIVENYAKDYNFVKLINFSRNFGHEIAVLAGLDYSKADYCAIIDADLQDPPELIKEMYSKIKEGYQVVYGQRNKRANESVFKKVTAYCFYRFMNTLSETKLPNDTGNFRLITADVRSAILKVREHRRFLRGIAVWVGFKSAPVYYDREGRFAGETHYPLKAMFRLAFNAIFEMSTQPLYVISWGGVLLLLLAVISLLMTKFLFGAVFLVGSLQLFALAIVGAYIGRIYEESKNRPLYIVDNTINL